MNTVSRAALLAFSLTVFALPAAAHHSLTAEFVPDSTIFQFSAQLNF